MPQMCIKENTLIPCNTDKIDAKQTSSSYYND
jgi:hypothetical protein